ncbi:hypothetical protein BZA05DRAFT_458932 [Tricharina praecox]|uniref:uncharacterized protein n=1 Tax=Tricharina praecox TaxID=43433 RepID=UPI00222034D8|nr:uncharacterized protein BZA05DRAFT_458932 [Tricharina praecox]KAI5845489.1 hypothetical protein BZA05DRAFT_458932 [Tricharina praecox]
MATILPSTCSVPPHSAVSEQRQKSPCLPEDSLVPAQQAMMFTKSPLFQPTSSGQSQIRPCRIEPFRWNKNHLDAIGATLTFDLHLDSSTALKPAFIDAVLNTLSPFSKLFRSIHHTNALQNIAKSSYRLTMIPPGPRDVEPRRYACVELVEHVLRYFCTSYDWPLFPLKLRYQEITVTWDPRGFIGSRVWLVVPRRRSPDFAEEAAYAVSLAQEFMDRDAQQEFAVWLVTVRAGSGAVVKATVSGALIKALETNGQFGGAYYSEVLITRGEASKVPSFRHPRVVDGVAAWGRWAWRSWASRPLSRLPTSERPPRLYTPLSILIPSPPSPPVVLAPVLGVAINAIINTVNTINTIIDGINTINTIDNIS